MVTASRTPAKIIQRNREVWQIDGLVGQLGNRVDRAADTLPQTTAEAIFNILGGRVAVTQLVGEVTTVIQTQANNTKLTATPTVGAAHDICAVLDITAFAAARKLGISGLTTDAMISTGSALSGQLRSIILPVGTLDLSCAASNTGGIKWTVTYIPIDDGAYMTATAV